MSAVTSVPTILAALLALVEGAVPAGVSTVDGQPTPNLYGDFVAVGWNDNATAVTATQAIADYAMASDSETYMVDSQIVTWTGDTDLATVRARAYTLLNGIAAALQADSRLGGACALARLAGHDYRPAQTDKGAMATVTFTVQIDAWK